MTLPEPRSGRRVPLVLGAVAGALFVALTVAVALKGSRPFGWDAALHSWFLRVRTPGLETAARGLTATGTGLPAYALAAGAGALGGGRRRWWAGALLAVGVIAAVQLLRLALSVVVDRPRPPAADWAAAAGGAAYPSGHTTTSAAVAVVVIVAVCRRTSSRAVRATVAGLAIAWAVGVGLTRVYLGVHWPSDVLGGWLLVVVVVTASTLTALSRLARRPGS